MVSEGVSFRARLVALILMVKKENTKEFELKQTQNNGATRAI
jgi:hypothetical protein